MKTLIKGREYKVKQTGNQFFYWSTRALRWLPVKRSRVLFGRPELWQIHARSHAEMLNAARAGRSNGGEHARLLEMARYHRLLVAAHRSFDHTRALGA